MNLFLRILVFVLALGVAQTRADGPDDDYVRVLDLIQQGDALGKKGQDTQAIVKYRQAQNSLVTFKGNYPAWNTKLITARLTYLSQKLSAPAGAKAGSSNAASATQPGSGSNAASSSASGSQVKLLEPGGEPRKALRLHPAVGEKQTVVMTMKMAMDTKMGDMPSMAMKLPPMKMTSDMSVTAVTPGGDFTYQTTLSDVAVLDDPAAMPQLAEVLKTSLGSMKGLTGTGTISDRGLDKGMQFKVPPGADPQLNQVLDQMKESFTKAAVALPEEPVGPGARWQIRMPIKSQGMTIDQTTTYELVSVEGERVTTRTTMTQRAANQKVQNPAMPQLKLDLTKMEGKGTGQVVFDLDKPLAPQASLDFHTQMDMKMTTAGQTQPMVTKVDYNLQLEGQ